MNESLWLIVVMLGAGYVIARMSLLPDNAADSLHRFVIYVCLPALVLSIVPKLRWEPGLLWVALTPWLLALVGIALVHWGARVLKLSDNTKAALLLCVPLGNTSFLGYPLLEALIGSDAIRIAVLYDQLGTFMLLSTYGLFVAARYGGEAKPTWSSVTLRLIKFPSFIALCVGLMIPYLPASFWPAVPQAIAARVGATLVPVAMFAVGLRMQLRPPRPWQPFVFGLVGKMLVLPLLALGLVRALGLSGLSAQVIVLESGMPTMVSAGALAMMAGLAPELAAALVGYGILLSLLSLPMFVAFMH